jgi:hypothetical protein
LQNMDNYKKLSEFDKALIISQLTDAVTSGKKPRYTICDKSDRNKSELNVLEAIRFLLSPVSLIIENSLNDSYFLKAIFNYFDPKKEDKKSKLIYFLENGWLQFVNAGGWTNIKNYVHGQLNPLEDFTQIHGRNKAGAHHYLRCFVLMDSDKRYHTQPIQDKADLKDWLETKSIQVHILHKRAMENYMPDEIIQELPYFYPKYSDKSQLKKWVRVYGTALTPNQKDYLDYKSGFPKKEIEIERGGKKEKQMVHKERKEQDPEIQALYAMLDEHQYMSLDIGLKDFPKFKDRFPQLFEKPPADKDMDKFAHYVNRKTLLQRAGGTTEKNEFLEIIEKIYDLL